MDLVIARASDDGATNNPLQWGTANIPIHMAIAAFTGIAWYNVIELNIAVFLTFKRKRGLYFWTVLLSIQGIALHSLAFILKLYGVISVYQISATLITIGWYLMVTGQSLVMYSRLHLIVSEAWLIRGVLFMIIWNAITLHIPTTVLTYGTNSPDYHAFYKGYRIMEKVQMTLFCVQELIISLIYIWATARFLGPFYKKSIRSVTTQLIWMSVVVIVLDLAMLIVEYQGYYSLEVAMKGAIYSVKLKIEFAVLNQLMRIAKASRDGRQNDIFDEDDDPSDPLDPGWNDDTGKGFRGFIGRLLPRTSANGRHHGGIFIDDANAIDPKATRKKSWPGQGNGNISVISASRPGPEDLDENMQGISVTKEVTQVSKQVDDRNQLRNRGKPIEYYPGSRNDDSSIELRNDGAESDNSQLELVELASSSSSRSGRQEGFRDGYTGTRVPRRTANPGWRKSRSGVTVTFSEYDTEYKK